MQQNGFPAIFISSTREYLGSSTLYYVAKTDSKYSIEETNLKEGRNEIDLVRTRTRF